MSVIKNYIKLMIENMRIKQAHISDGTSVSWGSPEHISDLELRINNLITWRDRQQKGSASRANYARLIDQLKSELRSARRASEKMQITDIV
jgi:hypothetical protein